MIQSYRNHLKVLISLSSLNKICWNPLSKQEWYKRGKVFFFQYQSTVRANSDNPAPSQPKFGFPGCPLKRGSAAVGTFSGSSLRCPARVGFSQFLTGVGDRNFEFWWSGKWVVKVLSWTWGRMWHFSAGMDSGGGEGGVGSQITWKRAGN